MLALMMEAVLTSETPVYFTRPHGAISHKDVIFIVAAVRT
jgi:hypothetical protein